MVVIWGLDLREIQWGKFKNSYMWNKEFHLRRTKFVVYQLAMIFCVFSESFGTKALDDYVHQQRHVEKLAKENGLDTSIYNNDFVGTESFNIFTGVYVATIFGSGFFFDLFWPMRKESKGVKIAWRVCSVLAICFALASAITITVVFSTRRAYIQGDNPDPDQLAQTLDSYKHGGAKDLLYKQNPYYIVSLAFIWPGLLATIASTIIMWMSLSHNDRLGPMSAHARGTEATGTVNGTHEPKTEVQDQAAHRDATGAINGTHEPKTEVQDQATHSNAAGAVNGPPEPKMGVHDQAAHGDAAVADSAVHPVAPATHAPPP